MVHLIDKDALVVEIEKLRKKNDAYDKPSHIADVCYKEILSFINTLEVKEANSNDRFIEKACEWLSKHAIKYYLGDSKFLGTDELVEDFKIAMKL